MPNSKKVFVSLLVIGALITLGACRWSKLDFKGTWQVTDSSGDSTVMTVTDKSILLDGKSATYHHLAKGNDHGNRYLTFISEGEHFTVFFPEKDNKTAILLATNGKDKLKGRVYLVMSQKEKPDFQKYVNRYLKGVKSD